MLNTTTTTVTIPKLEELDDKPKVMTPSYLAHIVLQTTQLAQMRDYYLTFLGAHVVFEAPFGTFLTYDEEHHRIALIQFPHVTPKVPTSAGLQHIAFTFSSLADLLTSYQQRLKHGIKPAACVNHGPTTSIYYKDPDGNSLETQVDNFETNQEATDYMMGEAFAKNPIGVEFKPEELMEKLRQGVSEKELMRRNDEQGWGIWTPESIAVALS